MTVIDVAALAAPGSAVGRTASSGAAARAQEAQGNGSTFGSLVDRFADDEGGADHRGRSGERRTVNAKQERPYAAPAPRWYDTPDPVTGAGTRRKGRASAESESGEVARRPARSRPDSTHADDGSAAAVEGQSSRAPSSPARTTSGDAGGTVDGRTADRSSESAATGASSGGTKGSETPGADDALTEDALEEAQAAAASASADAASGAAQAGKNGSGQVEQAVDRASAAQRARHEAIAALKAALVSADAAAAKAGDASNSSGDGGAQDGPAGHGRHGNAGGAGHFAAAGSSSAQSASAKRQSASHDLVPGVFANVAAEAAAAAGQSDTTGHGAPARLEEQLSVPKSLSRPEQAIAAFQAVAVAAPGGMLPYLSAAAGAADAGFGAVMDLELPTQIVHAIHVQADAGGGEARLRLNPAFLGGLSVGVQVDGSSVTASLHVSSAEVREWIRTNEAMLRQALADQGLHLESLVVSEEEPTDPGRDRSDREETREQQPRRQRRSLDQGTFEVVL